VSTIIITVCAQVENEKVQQTVTWQQSFLYDCDQGGPSGSFSCLYHAFKNHKVVKVECLRFGECK